jgi:hypothetical protein
MTRLEELTARLDNLNKNGGLPRDDWYMMLLTDIAVSLATIADELKEVE